ncbi:heparinase II/III domain-containing protein [Myceligenerans salitolerans]|uniref:Heparinase II/III family protein n=1 Tax=Myceligenerans salitolerans TaxID=1230528 RepID=A0ABS3I8H5_9MICO|nr:heparinase II/III family protein [Myceligenerans salitolerans]MBO0609321.1 heparinase II/III family protein [Myceligenerans salitolerans]
MSRLPAPDVTAREFWTSERMEAALTPAIEHAERALGTPWPEARASQFARFWRDGDRKGYESGVIARQQRLTYAAVAALHTGEQRFLDEVVDGVILLCEQSTWCWPAHEHVHDRSDYVVPDVTDPCLDLGAGEVAAQLAWVDHLLGPAIDDRAPGVRARIRQETRQRVLRPFTDRRDWWWLGIERPPMNWTVWIQGNVLAAALALEDDTARRRHIVRLVAEGVGRYWDSLPPDGGVDEGYHYWWQGVARALEAEDLLSWAGTQDAAARLLTSSDDARATAGPGDVAAPASNEPRPRTPSDDTDVRAETIRQVVGFPHRMHLGGDWYVGVADSPARPIWTWPWNLVHSWARRVGDDDAVRHAASYRDRPEILWDERVTLSRAVLMLSDDAWANLPAGTAPPLVAQVWLPETQVALARSRPGSSGGVAVFVKGGHNAENHNHNDVGEVVIALDGVPVVVDAGKPTYRAGTFGDERYDQWPMRSAWHNVPLISGTEQAPGEEFTARSMTVTSPDGDGTWSARLDLAGAYPVGGMSWWREVALDRSAESVTVSDSWASAADTGERDGEDHHGAEGDGATALHWLLAGDVTLDAATGQATVRHAAGRPDAEVRTLRITWDQDTLDATLEVQEIHDDELAAVWGDQLTRLALTARGEPGTGTGTGTSTVRFDAA